MQADARHAGVVRTGGGEMSDDRARIADAMIRHGGGFAQALGRALRLADATNAERIKRIWPEMWETYTLYAVLDGQRKKDDMQYRRERKAGIRCGNCACVYHRASFAQSCCASHGIGGEPLVTDCGNYVPMVEMKEEAQT